MLSAIIFFCIADLSSLSIIASSTTTTSSSWTAPRFLEVFTFKELNPGEWLSIKCTATGVPLPQITWSLDGFGLDSLDGLRTGDYVTNDNYVISFVNITSVKPDHGGTYSCKASSESGMVENSASIRVKGDPVVRPMGNVTSTAGTDVLIKCPAGGHPIEDIHWEKSECMTLFSLLLLKRPSCLICLRAPSFFPVSMPFPSPSRSTRTTAMNQTTTICLIVAANEGRERKRERTRK